MIINFEKYFYPLGDGPLKISEIAKDANDMTVAEAVAAKKIYENSGNINPRIATVCPPVNSNLAFLSNLLFFIIYTI